MKKKSSTKEYAKEQPVKKVKEPAAVYKTAKAETPGVEDELSEGEIQLLEERLLEYEKNPKSGKSLDTVIKAISKKHGFKYRH